METKPMSEDAKARLAQWFRDGDTWVGCFENEDLGHRDFGLRCAFPFSLSDGSFDKSETGVTRAPDGKTIGLGWRYVLQRKARTADEVVAFLEHNDV